MQTATLKKTIGTLGIFSVASVLLFASVDLVQARFINSRNNLNADGIVGSVGNNEFTLLTAGSDPIEIQVNNRTNFARRTDFDDLSPGDVVQVNARIQNGSVLARTIRIEDDDVQGYGTAGDRVLISEGRVTGKSGNIFTIETRAANISFRVTPSTRFLRTNYAFLNIGDRVYVAGEDTGSDFIAKRVIER